MFKQKIEMIKVFQNKDKNYQFLEDDKKINNFQFPKEIFKTEFLPHETDGSGFNRKGLSKATSILD